VEVSWNIINCSGLEFDQYDEVRISEWRSCVVKKTTQCPKSLPFIPNDGETIQLVQTKR
jgi:hypothetical protein